MFKLLGVNDDKDTCEKCGKTNLKKVAWIAEFDQDGNQISEPSHYGVDCASYVLMGDKKASSRKAIEYQGQVISYARNYLAKGFELRKVADWIGGKGFRVSVKEDKLILDFTVIELSSINDSDKI